MAGHTTFDSLVDRWLVNLAGGVDWVITWREKYGERPRAGQGLSPGVRRTLSLAG
jgi:hypothetical protein